VQAFLAMNRSAARRTFLCWCVLMLPVAAVAQQMYVDDKLVLNVHAEANQGGEKVATIETGDEVELLERVDASAHIRLPDGREGWVGANYLTADPPAVIRLKALRAETAAAAPTSQGPSPEAEATQKKLTEEVTRLKKQNAELLEETNKLKKAATAAPAPAVLPPPIAVPASVRAEPDPELDALNPSPRDPMRWLWPLVTLAVAGLAFLLGYHTLARRIRRTYGRVNII
jgi:Bacterial SH3 domain